MSRSIALERDDSCERSVMVNDLKLLKNRHPELFTTRSVYEEDPGMNFEFRVKERLSKHGEGMDSDPELDMELLQNGEILHHNRRPLKTLPIDQMRGEIAKKIRENKYTVIVGGTGSGKSTRVPQIILDDMIRANKGTACRIYCTQPRRVAATSIAKRVAFEMGEDVGQSVGYAIRGDVVPCRKEGATVTYCTSGVLVRKLIEDPALIGVSHVILDEIHERSMEQEMLVRFLRELASLRSRFKLIVMSATMNNNAYQKYLENCTVLKIQDSIFPVKEHYLDDMPDIIGTPVSSTEMENHERSTFVVLCLVEKIVKKMDPGAILIFVPGWKGMADLQLAFENYNHQQTDPAHMLKVRLLHSRVPLKDEKIFGEIKGPGRKVLISTTIAESSITVPDVVYVIDLGKANVSSYHEAYQTSDIKPEFITKASANQRRGRAGRVCPGVCFRMYTRAQFDCFPEYLDSEKGNQNVTQAILNVLSLGESVKIFRSFVNAPSNSHLNFEMRKLRRFKMIGPNNQLTLLGRRINEMSADPLVAKSMLLGSFFGCGKYMAIVSAGLATSRLFPMPQGHVESKKQRKRNRSYRPPTRSELTGRLSLSPTSDGLAIVGAIQRYKEAPNKDQFCRDYLLDEASVQDVLRLCQVVDEEMKRLKGAPERKLNYRCIENIMAGGFLPNVAMTKYTPRVHSAKLYKYGRNEYFNAPMESVLNKNTMRSDQFFTFNKESGIPPKCNMDLLNKIDPEALILFSSDATLFGRDTIMVEGYDFIGDENTIDFLMSLRLAWNNVFAGQLTAPVDIPGDDPKGQILDIIIRLLSK